MKEISVAVFNNLVLSGTDERAIRKQILKQERADKKSAALLQKEQNRQSRALLKFQSEQKQRARSRQTVLLQTVKHQPTYCIHSYKRIQDVNDETYNTQNFRTTPAFVSKSEIQSFKSQSRIKNVIGWMLLFADLKRIYCKSETFSKKTGKVIINKKTGKPQHNFLFRLAFITLTIPYPQLHSDDYVKEHMLQPFLYWLNRYYNCLYVWKAESQLNGDIHFHITIDTFIHWKSIRAKWNTILSKHGYCKVYQDGSNDKGNAATQVKAVRNVAQCARDIGGYMSKKDEVTKKDQKAIEDEQPGYKEAQVHCKFNPELKPEKQNTYWYKRVIEGRLWGCSENLSGINVFIDETDSYFQKEERIFFRQNPDIYCLGTKVIDREKEKYAKVDEAERAVRGLTDEDIEQRYRFMKNVFVHKHLSKMKKGAALQKLIHEEKLTRQKNFQKFFTVQSLN